MYSDKFTKLSVYELLKFRHISIINTRYCVEHVAFININYYCFDLSHLYIHTHTCTYTHTRTHTHTHIDLNFAIEFKFFNENIRSQKDSRQIERNKVKYLHYLNKMIEKFKMRKFIYSEASCFLPELFQRFCIDFTWLHLSFRIQ